MYEDRTVKLGGMEQTIGLEGTDDGAIMVMFHGGPWGPVIYGQAYRGYYPTLYENVGLVWWDQYGCGKNHAKNVSEHITVETFAEMSVDLVDYIHEEFPNRKLVLNGNSFGTYLAMYTAHKRPNIVDGVVCLSPICDMQQANANFENSAKDHYTPKEKSQVERLRAKGGIEFHTLVASKLAEKYTNCAHYKGKEAHDGLTLKWILRLLTSKDWNISDFFATLKASSTVGKSYHTLWNSLMDINMTEIYNTLEVPILILQGSEELYILPDELQKLSQRRENVTYVRFPHCGHIPTTESFPKMLEQMVEFVTERN